VAALPVALVYAPAIGVPRPVEVGLGVLFVLAVINALKCMDSADGVAAGVAVAGASSLGSLGGWDGAAGTTAAVVAGAAAGFLVFNAPPARCFLGEGGGTLLGLLLASVGLAMAGAAPPGRAVEVTVAAGTVLSVPVLDFALVHVRRARAGVRRLADLMASAGTDHLPHRLRDAGLGPWGVAAACAAAVAASGLVAHLSLRWGVFGVLAGAAGAVGVFLGAELSPVMRGTRFHPQRYRPTSRPVEAQGRSIPVRDPPAIKEA
jgi:UDP-GlcNAc:undecaprenyl-phosphate GlcNAc-1-phosphate transferase